MILNDANVDLAFQGFKTIYTDAYTNAPAHYSKVAMTVASGNRQETYGWLGQFPQLREWLDGERVIKDLEAHSFTILNRKFESTVDIRREDFEDDRLGLFKPMFAEMGHLARQHPDELIFGLLKDGFTTPCFDGQNYFDTEHQTPDADGNMVPVSNMADGTDAPWFLLDTSRAIRPLIWQARVDYTFDMVNRPNDERVFMTDKYLYGVRARVNAGFGLWQMAYASKQPLNLETYSSARAAMMELRGDKGRILGITPTTLVVPPRLEHQARLVLNTETSDGGGSNPWKNTAELIVTPYVTV